MNNQLREIYIKTANTIDARCDKMEAIAHKIDCPIQRGRSLRHVEETRKGAQYWRAAAQRVALYIEEDTQS